MSAKIIIKICLQIWSFPLYRKTHIEKEGIKLHKYETYKNHSITFLHLRCANSET